jgi:hypothetical protein
MVECTRDRSRSGRPKSRYQRVTSVIEKMTNLCDYATPSARNSGLARVVHKRETINHFWIGRCPGQ